MSLDLTEILLKNYIVTGIRKPKTSVFTVQKFHYYSTIFPEYLTFQYIQQTGLLLIAFAIVQKNFVLLILIFTVL